MELFLAQMAQVPGQNQWWLNPWVLAIVPSIISGVLVNLISRSLWSRRDNKELRQKIDQANSEVLYALRPSVAEGSMPSNEILDALINGTARKYYLEPGNLMKVSEFADELVKEVMDSTFLSHEQKIKYASEVIGLNRTATPQYKSALSDTTSRLGTADPYYVYRHKLMERSVQMLTVATVLVTLMGAVLSTVGPDSSVIDRVIFGDERLAPVFLAASAVPFAMAIYIVLLRLKRLSHKVRQSDAGLRTSSETKDESK